MKILGLTCWLLFSLYLFVIMPFVRSIIGGLLIVILVFGLWCYLTTRVLNAIIFARSKPAVKYNPVEKPE